MIPRERIKDSMEGIQVDTANTLLVTLLHRVHILPDKGIRSHLVDTRLKVDILNLVDTRRRTAHTLQKRILQVDILNSLAIHQLVTQVMVNQCPYVYYSHGAMYGGGHGAGGSAGYGAVIAGGAAAAAAAYGAHKISHGHGGGYGMHGHGHHGKFKHGKFKHGKFGKHKKMFGKHKKMFGRKWK
ncbi:hypothetical protein HU200_012970 [Digitaria exilis]|uniref:Glycine-rich protein n=1 Tax=Digitaria exilis TaxID=1010633 RepID=A0A835FE31_9POAL|nr:hypothetical protein HU200_012970 [Digitaria exilis]